MSHKIHYLLIIALLCAFQSSTPEPPRFQMWFDCVLRGQYDGQAFASVSYRYDGTEPIQAEDARWFGDTPSGDTEIQVLVIEPGEHLRVRRVNVGALKVVTLKVVLFGRLHVLTLWDNPEILECPPDVLPLEATPEATIDTTGSV